MHESIRQLAQYLDLNDVPGVMDSHLEMLEELFFGFRDLAERRGYSTDVAKAVFGYVANHHGVELDSYARARNVLSMVFEFVCPTVGDDERSRPLLTHLQESLESRLGRL